MEGAKEHPKDSSLIEILVLVNLTTGNIMDCSVMTDLWQSNKPPGYWIVNFSRLRNHEKSRDRGSSFKNIRGTQRECSSKPLKQHC